MTTDLDDDELLIRTLRDPAAFEPLVERYSAALHGDFARRAPEAPAKVLWLTSPARDWNQLDQLPTDRTRLAAELGGTARSRVPAAMELLESAPISPRLRAALFEVLSVSPGLRLIGAERDGEGRSGVAVEVDDGGRKSSDGGRVVFAPATGRILETAYNLGAHWPAPLDEAAAAKTRTSLVRCTYLESGPIDRLPPPVMASWSPGT